MLGLIAKIVAFVNLVSDLLSVGAKVALYLVGAVFGRSTWVRCWVWNRLLRRRSICPTDRVFLWAVGKHDKALASVMHTAYLDKIERTRQVSLKHYLGTCVAILVIGGGLASVFLVALALLLLILVEDKQ